MRVQIWPFAHSNGKQQPGDAALDDDIREEFNAIRRRADDEALHDLQRAEFFLAGVPEYTRRRLIAEVLRRDREREDRELREIAQRLSPSARQRLFNETLDPHLM